jgi:hypothetical protein
MTAFSRSALLRRGWTLSLIARVLGAEDQLVPNQQYPGTHDISLYSRARVLEAERGPEFFKMLERRQRAALKRRRTHNNKETP